MKKHILLFILLNAFFSVEAKYYDLVNITNNDGLSNSSVTTIFQNSSGLMWFGTWDGLNAYNGREFKVYKPEPGNSQSICNNIIRDIIEEDKETQWIATDLGISRMDLQRKTLNVIFRTGKIILFITNTLLIAKIVLNKCLLLFTSKVCFVLQRRKGL